MVGRIGRQSVLDFFQAVQQFVNAIGRGSELANDFAILGILLGLQGVTRLIDKPQALRDFLALVVANPKDSAGGRRRFVVEAAAVLVPIAMPFSS